MRNNQKQHGEAEDEFWYCPYCVAIEADDLPNYANQRSMMNHIQTSTKESSGDAHDTMKGDDGWYDEEWAGVNTETRKRRHSEEKAKSDRKILRRYNMQYSDDVELLKPIPHPTIPGVVLGGPSHPEDMSIPDHLTPFISCCGPDDTSGYEVPEAYKGIIKYADPDNESDEVDITDFKGILSHDKGGQAVSLSQVAQKSS